MKKVLMLAANPKNISQLRLDQEFREIKVALKLSRKGGEFILEAKWAVRVEDFVRAILEVKPQIVHFSAHGTTEEGLIFEDELGYSQSVSSDALAALFELFSNQVECVVLNGCYSEVQAKAIAEHVEYVIGMNNAIRDETAIEFLVGFYDALGEGRSIDDAFKFGSVAIKLAGVPEEFTPILIKKNQENSQAYYAEKQKSCEEEYTKEYAKAIEIGEKFDSKNLQILNSFPEIRNEDLKAIQTRVEDIEEIRLAVNNQSIRNCQRLAQAIMRWMGATDLNAITSPHFPNGSLWEMSLPQTGLQLPTQNAIFYLSQEINSTLHNHLKQITQQRDGTFLIFVSVSDCYPHGLTPLQVIWLSCLSLREMIAIPEDDLLIWLARFLFGQINVVALPGMLPYKTKGSANKLFFGRENELARITSGNQRGGIIIGAHRSGKTSFLEKLKETLQKRQCKVIGPLTFFEFESFFKETLEPLGKNFSKGMSIEDWSCALKAYSQNNQQKRLVFLFDEVDKMIQEDFKNGANLGQKMRALQNQGYCEFFLAGHAKLREAIAIEGGPFRNFAEEITLTGLTKEAATDLIQTPMKLLGFELLDAQAIRIYKGTAGVAVLIQEFCLQLLDQLRQSGVSESISEISDTAIEEVEQSPDFLDIVFEHYRYGQTWDSMAITLLTAIRGEVQRKDITQVFKENGIILSRDKLDNALNFLKQFGVLEKLRNSRFCILSGYLIDAIKTNDPDSFLESELAKGRENNVSPN